ncbi:MAG: flagellar basal body L-ring protein FlgH [Acidobacteriota bacterium]|nr:MAG: flagellar basal body L-ring protein FlgH [Acidobacteriota bacterium]
MIVRPYAAAALIIVALVSLGGCTSTTRLPDVEQQLPDVGLPTVPHYVSAGSLFNETSASQLISDLRARHVGDVLLVEITESSLAKSSADSKLDKESSTKLEAPTIFGWENKVKGELGPDFDPALAFETATTKSFEGEGETNRQGSLVARLAVRVVAVGGDGRMVVAGSKRIKVNRESEMLTLAGIVRREDVGPANLISSATIADLSITYGGTGDVADMTRQGWFQRLLDKIWPF